MGSRDKECAGWALGKKKRLDVSTKAFEGNVLKGEAAGCRPYFQKENSFFLLTLPLRYSLYCEHGTGKEAFHVKNMKEGMILGAKGRAFYGTLWEPCIPWR